MKFTGSNLATSFDGSLKNMEINNQRLWGQTSKNSPRFVDCAYVKQRINISFANHFIRV